jgi:hypothetical protein
MTIEELREWLLKVEKEGADLVEAEMDCLHGKVKLIALEERHILVDTIEI